MAIYGYARCSTNEDRQNIERQVRELKQSGCTDETIYKEYESGTKADRVEFNRLWDKLQEGDTIVCTEVSRLSRSTLHLCELIKQIEQKHLCLIIIKAMTIDCRNGELDCMTKAFLQMSAVFAELERNMISDRVKSGMANAKASGKQIGRNKTTVDDIPASYMRIYRKYQNGEINKSQLAVLANVARNTSAKYIKLLEGEE